MSLYRSLRYFSFSASATAVIVLLVNTRQPMAGDLDWSEFLMIGFTHHMEILSKVWSVPSEELELWLELVTLLRAEQLICCQSS